MGKEKIPFAFTPNNDETFSLAGLYDVWKVAEGQLLETFTIITCEANKLLMGLAGVTGGVVQHLGPLSEPEARIRLAGFLEPTTSKSGLENNASHGLRCSESRTGVLATNAVLQVSSAKQRGHRPRCLD